MRPWLETEVDSSTPSNIEICNTFHCRSVSALSLVVISVKMGSSLSLRSVNSPRISVTDRLFISSIPIGVVQLSPFVVLKVVFIALILLTAIIYCHVFSKIRWVCSDFSLMVAELNITAGLPMGVKFTNRVLGGSCLGCLLGIYPCSDETNNTTSFNVSYGAKK